MRTFFSVLLITSAFNVSAADFHIADDVQLFMHSGPSYEYRIVSRVRSGDPVSVIERGKDYTKVKLADGKEGWMLSRYIAEGNSQLVALKSELPSLRQQVKDLTEQLDNRSKQVDQLSAELQTYKDETSDTTSKLIEKDSKIRSLEFEVSNMDQSNMMRWLTHGGLIALAGLIIGLIVPSLPRRKKKRDEWF